MNNLGTVIHDYSSRFMEMHLKYANESNKRNKPQKRDKTFRVNPKWHRAFTGRSEYERF